MKTATGLTVIAIGAILAFAITASPGFLDLHAVGWILMATGAVGLLLTPRSQDWLRRRVIIRRVPSGPPRPRSARQLTQASTYDQANRDHYPSPGGTPPAPESAESDAAAMTRPIERPATDDGGEETIEEYVER